MILIHSIIEVVDNNNQGYYDGISPLIDKIKSMDGCVDFQLAQHANESMDYIDIKFIKDDFVHVVQKWQSLEHYNRYLLSDIKSQLRDAVHPIIKEFKQYVLDIS